MDYNTDREKLVMPEYGRHIQKMIESVKQIPDREKRNEQIKAVVQVMDILNPHLLDQADSKQKLWDHAHIIAGFDLDIDSPYPKPSPEEFAAPPAVVHIDKEPLKAAHYGRNIQNMVKVIAAMPEDEERDRMIKAMAVYMRQQYLIWNKDTVSEQTIFKDIEQLSEGRLVVPEHIHLDVLPEKNKFNNRKNNGYIPMGAAPAGGKQFHKQGRKNNKKWKKQQ